MVNFHCLSLLSCQQQLPSSLCSLYLCTPHLGVGLSFAASFPYFTAPHIRSHKVRFLDFFSSVVSLNSMMIWLSLFIYVCLCMFSIICDTWDVNFSTAFLILLFDYLWDISHLTPPKQNCFLLSLLITFWIILIATLSLQWLRPQNPGIMINTFLHPLNPDTKHCLSSLPIILKMHAAYGLFLPDCCSLPGLLYPPFCWFPSSTLNFL